MKKIRVKQKQEDLTQEDCSTKKKKRFDPLHVDIPGR